MSSTSNLISNENKKEIFYNVINSFLAGTLVFLGSLTTGHFTIQGLMFAFLTSVIVAITKFKDYWDSEKKEYCSAFMNFI